MVKDVTALFREAFELPERERATLAGLLIESLEAEPDSDLEEAHSVSYGWQPLLTSGTPSIS